VVQEVPGEGSRWRRREQQRRDGSSVATIELDAGGVIVGWNPAAERVFGWQAAELVGRGLAPLMAEPAAAGAMFAALVAGDPPARSPNRRSDGAALMCHWHSVVVRDEDGALDRIYCEVRELGDEDAQRQRQQLMQALADHSPLGIFAKGPDGRYVYANHEFARSLGRAAAEVVGRDDFELFTPAIAESLRRHDAAIIAAGTLSAREDRGVGPDSDRSYWSLKFPLHDEAGRVFAVCGLVNDITPLRRSEAERAALQQQVIAELSTPLLPLAAGVLAMPLIGAIDAARAELIMETLLAGVVQQRARAVILDLTGVRVVDGRAAQGLMQAARAAHMLGAASILTGISAELASALVELDVDLRGLVTLGSLRSGVEYALRRSSAPPRRREPQR